GQMINKYPHSMGSSTNSLLNCAPFTSTRGNWSSICEYLPMPLIASNNRRVAASASPKRHTHILLGIAHHNNQSSSTTPSMAGELRSVGIDSSSTLYGSPATYLQNATLLPLLFSATILF